MPLNIEVKAKNNNPSRINEALTKLGLTPAAHLWQEDTFFAVPRGRLKIRCDEAGQCELIYYRRRNEPGLKVSSYFRRSPNDIETSRMQLTTLFGIKNIIKKKRTLFLLGGARVHLDHVDGLGDFVEIEVPMITRSDENRAKHTARRIMKELSITEDELLSTAYEEMTNIATSER